MIDDKFYVKKLIRDDGEVFEFDGIETYLATENILLVRPDIQSSDVEYTDASGGEMIRQRLVIHEQPFNGIIYPRNTDYWALYFSLSSFFKINHAYQIIYRQKSGAMFAQKGAWLATNLQVNPPADEDFSNFSFGMRLKNSLMHEYAENSEGEEVYANSVVLPLLTSNIGGERWDAVGDEWDAIGAEWEGGGGGVQNVSVNSISKVYPVWTVQGSAVNPTLQNNTTDTFAIYNGTVAAGQTLVVDFAAGTARLDGSLVSRNVSGEVSFAPGINLAGFNIDTGTAENSRISWNNIIGGGDD